MLQGVQDGYNLPEYVSRDEYYRIKNNPNEDKIKTGFVEFGCSFGGKDWGGYAKNKAGTNYALQSKNSLLKDMKYLSKDKVVFLNKDYRDVILPSNSVILCDPPYADTTKYRGIKFDTEAFWEYMREISKKHLVFICEQNAPDDFVLIWEKPFTRTLDRNKNNQFKVVEKLFIKKQ